MIFYDSVIHNQDEIKCLWIGCFGYTYYSINHISQKSLDEVRHESVLTLICITN